MDGDCLPLETISQINLVDRFRPGAAALQLQTRGGSFSVGSRLSLEGGCDAGGSIETKARLEDEEISGVALQSMESAAGSVQTALNRETKYGENAMLTR